MRPLRQVCAKLQVNDDVSGSTGLVVLVDGRTNSLVIANGTLHSTSLPVLLLRGIRKPR